MKYVIKSVYGDKYIYQDKRHLFNDLDNLSYSHGKICTSRLRSYLSEDFIIGRNGQFEISSETFEVEVCDGEYRKITEYLRSNALYIIYTEFGEKVNLDHIIQQYIQSRDLKHKARKRYFYDRSTKKSQLNRRKSKHLGTARTSGLKKEYQNSFYALEYKVKIRQKRFEVARSHHVFYFDNDYCRNKTKAWKSHRKNQYR
jgi:hypothetical protein